MDKDFLNSLVPPPYTPDYKSLEFDYAGHIVFDPGPIAYNEGPICSAYTVEKLSLYKTDRTTVAFRAPKLPKGRVRGTLYYADSDDICRLDKAYKNGVEFERCQTPIVVRHGEERIQFSVWMYQGDPQVWADKIGWDQSFNRQNPTFQEAYRFPDENTYYHNHYAVSAVQAEHANLPPPKVYCNPNTLGIGDHNSREIARIKREKLLRPLRNLTTAMWQRIKNTK